MTSLAEALREGNGEEDDREEDRDERLRIT